MFESLRDAVRSEATDRIWSQGVALARDHRVVGQGRSGDEVSLEVRVPGRPTPFEVILNPAHGEWECSCPGEEAVCAHVVAAVLAAEQAGDELPKPVTAGATLRYLLTPATGGIAVQRVLVRGDRAEPFEGVLMSMVAKGKASAIATIEADLLADPLITARGGPIHGDRLERLLGVLAEARDVRWKGEPITTSTEPVLPRALIEDARGGVRVTIEADPIIREVVAIGIVRTADNMLRPIGAVDLAGAKLEKLPQRFDVSRSAFPELIGKTIPALAQRIEVSIRARSLPEVGGREEPRMLFDVEQDGDRLKVFPTLVYGEPPRARIDGGRVVHLGGALPIRDEDAERKLVHRLRES